MKKFTAQKVSHRFVAQASVIPAPLLDWVKIPFSQQPTAYLTINESANMFVNANMFETAPNGSQGEVYIYTTTGRLLWEKTQTIASNDANTLRFGLAIELSADGQILLVSAQASVINSAPVQVYKKSGSLFELIQEIPFQTDAGYPETDALNWGVGLSISDDNKTIAISNPETTISGNSDAGCISIFEHDGNEYKYLKFVAPDVSYPNQKFSMYNVVLSGNGQYLIGANNPDTGHPETGKIVYFSKSGGWVYQSTFPHSTNWNLNLPLCDISFDGLTVCFGDTGQFVPPSSAGVAWVYRYNGSSWIEAEFTQEGIGIIQNPFACGFGFSPRLCASGNIFYCSAPFAEINNIENQGVIFEYHQVNGQWLLKRMVEPAEKNIGETFGMNIQAPNNNLQFFSASIEFVYNYINNQ